MLNETLLTIDEVASYLKVSRRQVYNYLKNHNLPAVKMGKYWRIYEKDLYIFLEGFAKRTKPEHKE
jgi:excisionase family DNA binding protein